MNRCGIIEVGPIGFEEEGRVERKKRRLVEVAIAKDRSVPTINPIAHQKDSERAQP